MSMVCPFFNGFSQTLEVHQISVGQGDGAIIVVRDTARLGAALDSAGIPRPAARINMFKTAMDSVVDLSGTVTKAMLIDAGKGSKQGQKIYQYAQKIGVSKFQYSVLSHYHDDHYGGFKSLVQTYGMQIDTAYDRGYYNRAKKPTRTARTSYINIFNSNRRKQASCDSTNLLLGTLGGQQIRLTNVANAGYVFGDVHGDAGDPGCGNDENNYSLGWILQYGAFRFFTGGDLNGVNSGQKIDLESYIVDSVRRFDNSVFVEYNNTNDTIPKSHVCGLKLNHHGGKESTNTYFLSRLRPKTVLISCGYDKGYKHPRVEVIRKIDSAATPRWDIGDWKAKLSDPNDTLIRNTVKQYLVTSLMPQSLFGGDATLYNSIGTAGSKGVIGGDLVLIVDDQNIATQSKYLVYWNGWQATTANVVTKAVKACNAAGTKYMQCHRAPTLQYLTNH